MKSLIKLSVCAILAILVSLTIDVMPKKIESLEKRVGKHVVSFNVLIMDNKRYATGFYLKYEDNTYIVTNKHVCDAHKRIYGHKYIQFESYVGEIIAIDNIHDLCLVTSDRNDGLELAEEESEPMEELILIGHPRGIGKTIRKGHYISLERVRAPWIGPGYYDSIQISCQAYGGNSGSPVVNKFGKVAGVLFAGSPAYPGEPLMVPLSYLQSFLEKNAG